jgi:hypothetical protein
MEKLFSKSALLCSSPHPPRLRVKESSSVVSFALGQLFVQL